MKLLTGDLQPETRFITNLAIVYFKSQTNLIFLKHF